MGEEAFQSNHSPEVRTLASQTTQRHPRRAALLALRAIGALALIAMGVLHLQQYYDAGYSALPTIGTLFVLNFAGGVALGLALLLPVERLPGRAGAIAVPLLALTGAAMAATSIVFLLVSEQTPLFGFLETSTSSAITYALLSESIATAALGVLGVLSATRVKRTRAPALRTAA
jgi:hypothetical protein